MKRRDTLKTLALGSIGTGLLISSCDNEPTVESTTESAAQSSGYGRTAEEAARDAALQDETFFDDHEIATLAVLCNLIIPADDVSGSATDADVPAFIEFMAKDIPSYQTTLRGGMRWLDYESNALGQTAFKDLPSNLQTQLLDRIAYPDKATPEDQHGVKFFNLIRNLTATGFFTTQMGVKDLGYKGNIPNVWDGVPDDVLAEHGFTYDDGWKDQYVTPEDRNSIIQWDDQGNIVG